jgi:hypothetical protein
VNIENLLSVEAVREFGQILFDAIQTCCNFNKHQPGPGHQDQQLEPLLVTAPQLQQHNNQQKPVANVSIQKVQKKVGPTSYSKQLSPLTTQNSPTLPLASVEMMPNGGVPKKTQKGASSKASNSHRKCKKQPNWRGRRLSVWKIYDEETKMEQLLKEGIKEDQKMERAERVNRR